MTGKVEHFPSYRRDLPKWPQRRAAGGPHLTGCQWRKPRIRLTRYRKIGGEHGAEPVPPVARRLMAKIAAALARGSSAFRIDSGNRTYIITTRRITSGDELK